MSVGGLLGTADPAAAIDPAGSMDLIGARDTFDAKDTVVASEIDRRHMLRALALAAEAAERGEVPVGAVLVGTDGEVLGEGSNGPIGSHDPTAHAEIVALRGAARRTGNYRLPGTTLYVTLEPCPMCAGAIVHARVARLVFAAADPKSGACGSVMDIVRSPCLNHRVRVESGLLEPQAAAQLKAFFEARR